jgi:hypothetical protein
MTIDLNHMPQLRVPPNTPLREMPDNVLVYMADEVFVKLRPENGDLDQFIDNPIEAPRGEVGRLLVAPLFTNEKELENSNDNGVTVNYQALGGMPPRTHRRQKSKYTRGKR